MRSLAATPCLVTGAGGFIGGHLVEALVERGARVRAFVHYGSSDGKGTLRFVPAKVVRQVEVIAGDILDVETVSDAVRGMDTVFHLAALVGIPYSYRSPRDVVETNVLGTLNVLTAARTHGVRRVVHTSTSEVYGSAQTIPMSETHPLIGQSPYSASKIGADQLAISFHRSYGLPVSIVRPFNTYGPRQTSRAIIPTIVAQALAGRRLTLGSVSPTRDFNYVTDTANGFLAVAGTDTAVGDVYNVGTGAETSIAELIGIVGRLVGRDLELVQDPERVRPSTSEVYRLVSDSSRIRAVTGRSPQVTLEEGLQRTVDWMATNLERYAPDAYSI